MNKRYAYNRTGLYFQLIVLLFFFSCEEKSKNEVAADENWEIYKGASTATQHSTLNQINTKNVEQLTQAWTFRTGDAGERTTIQCNPIIIDGKMYVTSPMLKVIALNAATGEELWRYTPESGNTISGVNRGVTYWQNGKEERIFFTAGYHLIALNAKNGEVIESFGNSGKVDLREGLGRNSSELSLVVTSPGTIYKNLIIMGSATGEGYDASPGHIRAYNVVTGNMEWIFHTIPQEGEFGYDTWEWQADANYGAANVWGGISLDPETGMCFLATGSPSYDFYGASRIGDNLFGNCVVALDAASGKYRWHYQVIRHDLWDYDLPCAPVVTTITKNGKDIKAVAQPTKMGFLIVLEQATGKPLYEMTEIEVPASDIPGEVAKGKQPYPATGFFTRQSISEADLRDFDTGSGTDPKNEYAKYKWLGEYTPPSLQGSLAMPGTWGGGLWGGASVDPKTQTLYINANELASINKLRPVIDERKVAQLDDRPEAEQILAEGKNIYQLNCASCHGLDKKGVPPAFPALQDISKKYSTEEASAIIRNGKGAMPAYAQFSDNELVAIVNYLNAAPEETDLNANDGKQVSKYVAAGYQKFLDDKGYPLTKPPWGSLNAIDLVTGKLKWKQPLGEIEELSAMGIPKTGNRNFGGCITTAGGLVFIGAATDEKIRAFSSETGDELWQAKLPAAGFATPSTYMVNGEQYVVIAAGGGGRGATPSGDYYIAFKLE